MALVRTPADEAQASTLAPTPHEIAAPTRVALLVASIRAGRRAGSILGWLAEELAQVPALEVDVIDLRDHPEVVGLGLAPGGPTSPIAERLRGAEAFVVLTPEYNHSYPAALKHVIDLHRVEWAYKPVAFVSYGAMSGGIRAVEHLRAVFPELSAVTTRNAVTLRSPWSRTDPTTGRFSADPAETAALHHAMAELSWWSRTLRDGRRHHPLPS